MRKLLILIMIMGILTIGFTAFGSTGTGSASYPVPVPVFSILITVVLVVIFWMIPAIVCAEAARRKGLSHFWFCVFSLFFTPILGLLAVIAMTPKKKTLIEEEEILDEETYGKDDVAFHIGKPDREEY